MSSSFARFALLAAPLLGVPASAQQPAVADAIQSSKPSTVLVAAHRGGYANDKQDNAPENSVENIAVCRRKGYDLYETDIQRTRDGHFVIMHDATIDRETDGTGEVRDTTLAALKTLHKRFRDGTVSEARVATLDEFLTHGKGVTVFKADLKPGVSEYFDDLVRFTMSREAADQVIYRVHFRELSTFVRHRENGVTWPRGLVMFRVRTRKQLDKVIETFDPTIIHIDVAKADPTHARTLDLVRYAVGQNIDVQVHAEGDEDDWATLIDAGVRMFHSSKPAAVREFLIQRGRAASVTADP